MVIWIIGSLFEQKKRQQRRAQRPTPARPVEDGGGERPGDLPAARREVGSRLEEVLRQLDPALADAISQSRKPTPRAVPRPEPQVVSTETELDQLEELRARRPEIDRAEEGAEIGRRRLAEAAARNRPRRASDHAAFHDAIRAPEDAVEVARHPRYDSKKMRDAVVWREIIGPPKAFSDE